MSRYPDIGDHGLIGDLQTAALVATDGTVDWFCCPRFDSPSVSGRCSMLTRAATSGSRPTATTTRPASSTYPDTAILITRFITAEGVGEVFDFMPIAGTQATDRHRLVRIIRVVRGTMDFAMRSSRASTTAGRRTRSSITEQRGACSARRLELTLHASPRQARDLRDAWAHARPRGDGPGGRGRCARARSAASSSSPWPATRADLARRGARLFEDDTASVLARLAGRSNTRSLARDGGALGDHPQADDVRPTGGLVAAPTVGLPEQVGGERNWDYRYTWVRDASFSVYALLGLGFTEEADAFGSGCAIGSASVGQRVRPAEDHVPRRRVART